MEQRLTAGQIDLLFEQSPILLAGVLFLLVVTTAFLWKTGLPQREILFWAGANGLLIVLRLGLIHAYRRRDDGEERVFAWGLAFVVTAGLSGLLWGSLAIWALRPDGPDSIVYITTVLSAMASASLSSLSCWLPAYFAYLFSSLSLLIVGLVTSGRPSLALLGLLIGVLVIAHVSFAVLANRSVREGLALRDENADLLAITRRQKELAVRANEDKTRFLAAASHDLRQPLHALDLFLGALEPLVEENRACELLAKARESSRALGELLNALLDISRLDSGLVVAEPRIIRVQTLLDEVFTEFEGPARERGLELRVHDCSCWIRSDPVLLMRMLRNLVGNAVRYTTQGRIVVGCRRRNGHLRIEVHDTGPGIPEAERERIFEEFHQIDNPGRDRRQGLGLGLAIVRRLARVLEHPVELISRPGRGSRFALSVPVAWAVVSDRIADGPEDVDGLAGTRVLVIDDERAIRDGMAAVFQGWRCEPLLAADLDEARACLSRLAPAVPDLIVSDHRLSGSVDGLAVIDRLREEIGRSVPALLITGDVAPAIAEGASAAGCRLLIKPVDPRHLYREALAALRG